MTLVGLKKFVGLVLIVLFILVVKDIPLTQIQAIPDTLNISASDIIAVNNDALFGKYVSLGSKNQELTKDTRLDFKLFGFIKLNSVKVNLIESKNIYVGGNPVGFSLSSNGLIVVGANSVLTKEGKVDTLKSSDIKVGDIIKEIEGEQIASVLDVDDIINRKEHKDKELNIKAIRKNKEIDIKLKPALDLQSNKYKMGLWVRDDAAGVGTLTYVRKDNSRFGALGHAICDIDTKVPFSVNDGKMYRSNIIGIKRGRQGVPGELKGLFVKNQNIEAVVDKNSEFGVFGVVEKNSKLLSDNELVEVGGRLTARPGKAKIRVGLEGQKIEEYDIEIVKTNYQNISKQKSMVIKVTDKKLLQKTGGIVQGMSGSPIIQNGKLIGAVTHVFVNDPKRGFGVYLDWMINE